MPISLKSQKMLWGRAAARCSHPECRLPLVQDISETDDPTLVGENCHIVAEKDDGPRGDKTMPLEARNRYANLILLCNVHHKIIDDNEVVWTVEKLTQLKSTHEAWVQSALGLDVTKLREDTIYADYIEEWVRLAHLDEWKAWSSWVLGSGQPRIREEIFNDLGELRAWFIGRVWLGRYPTLEAAFHNFYRVLQDFYEMLRTHLHTVGNGMLSTQKFYQIKEWNPALYKRLSEQYDFHVDIVSDLMVELTRAGNLVSDEVRRHILYSFRLKEGRLVVQRGPTPELQWEEFAALYRADEAAKSYPYPGLEKFYDERAERDYYVGRGRPS